MKEPVGRKKRHWLLLFNNPKTPEFLVTEFFVWKIAKSLYVIFVKSWSFVFFLAQKVRIHAVTVPLMLGSHCRAICYEHFDWKIVADRGTFL